MAMSSGGGQGRVQSEINVTPMIDVLLVLLVVFMVLQGAMRSGVSLQVPPLGPPGAAATDPIVLEVEPGPRYTLNREPVAASALEGRIREVYASRPRKVIFVRGSERVAYGEVVRAVDAVRAAGVEVVGLVPRTAAR